MRNEQQARRLAILRSATAHRVGSKQTYATMRKSALIATCLTHSAMVPDVNAGEAAVRQVFEEYFPCERFESWNSLVIGSAATANQAREIGIMNTPTIFLGKTRINGWTYYLSLIHISEPTRPY